MSDTSESSSSPFAAFSTASGFDMLEKMWKMMQMPGMGDSSSPSSMVSSMMAPMTNIDELDKRITDMRAVEQWLKFNLNLLQSAIQALEVQRATLATLKAFGAFAQSSMEQAGATAPEVSTGFEKPVSGVGAGAAPEGVAAPEPLTSMDPTLWWNLLQAQFNQIATLAMAGQSTPPASSGPTAQAPAADQARKPAGAKKPAAKAAAKPARKAASAKSTGAPEKT